MGNGGKLTAVLGFCLLCATMTVGCRNEEKDAAAEQKEAFRQSMRLFYEGKIDSFIDAVDYAGYNTNDPIRRYVLRSMLRTSLNEQQKKGFKSIETTTAKIVGDSTTLVYYDIIYSNGTRESHFQKMCCQNGKWKIRMKE